MSDLCKACNFRKAIYRKSHYRFSKYKIYFCSAKGKLIESAQDCDLYMKKNVEFDVSDSRLKETERDIEYLLKKLIID